MSIYKYTMKKFLKSWSTWIIIFIAVAITFVIMWLTYYKEYYENISASSYSVVTAAIFSGVVSLIIFLGAIFTGFKGAQTYKDEVEDGTFLIVLSKPQTRSKIIFYKWLALATICILFLIALLLSFVLAIICFGREPVMSLNHNNDWVNISIYHNLLKDVAILFAIGLVLIMILSSIALIVSTKISTGGTIGIVVAIGVAVPITAIIGQVSRTTTYDTSFVKKSSYNQINYIMNSYDEAHQGNLLKVSQKEYLSKIINDIYIGGITNQYTSNKQINEGGHLGFIGINTNKIVSFSYFSYIDLSYQSSRLSSIVRDVTSTTSATNDANAIAGVAGDGGPGNIKKQKFLSSYNTSHWNTLEHNVNSLLKNGIKHVDSYLKNQNLNTKIIEDSINWSLFIDYSSLIKAGENVNIKFLNKKNMTINEKIEGYFSKIVSAKKLDKFEYVDFINKYAILVTYIVIAVILLPSSYFLLRKQDFR